MRELALFEQYLEALRREKLQSSHHLLLGALDARGLEMARGEALSAELCNRILVALRALANDPGLFIKDFLPK